VISKLPEIDNFDQFDIISNNLPYGMALFGKMARSMDLVGKRKKLRKELQENFKEAGGALA